MLEWDINGQKTKANEIVFQILQRKQINTPCHIANWITMLSVWCEILVTTESKLAAVSPRPGTGDDRGQYKGTVRSQNPEQNQITPSLHHWAGMGTMAHLCLTFHS